MQLAISIPQLVTGTFDAQGVKAYLARAEELGFEAGWVMEQSIGPTPLIAPLEMLAYAAACTDRLRLGVAVLVSSLHDPLQLASAVTAVDRLSHGRVEVGVSPGGAFRDFAAFGVDRETFVGRFTEGLQPMKGPSGLTPKFWMGCGDSTAECPASRMSPSSALLRTWCVACVKSRTPVPK
ncbi:MAG TPA: LLM class flavin-dependent oxidoreductase [Propionibacteriaceae bacterium]